MPLLIIIFFQLMLFTSPLYAETISVGDQSIRIAYPEHYCVAGNHPRERMVKQAMDAVKPSMFRILFAKCTELDELRAGTRSQLDHFGTVDAIAKNGAIIYTKGVSRQQFLAQMQGATSSFDESVSKAETRLKQTIKNVNSVESLGVIGSDSFGLYAALITTGHDQSGKYREVLGVTSLTLVETVPLSVALFNGGDHSRDMRTLLANLQILMKDLVQSNE